MTSQQETFKIFVLRHGQSELNHENIFCGWIDAKLTEKGKQQARNSAQLIKQYCEANEETLPQIGYTSRLVRTQQTMEVIMDELALKGNFSVISGDVHALKKIELPQEALVKGQLPVLQTWRLNERHYGAWQGQRKPNVLKDVGDEEYMRIRRDYRGKPPLVDLSLEMVQPNEKGAATGYEFKEPNRTVKYATEDAAGETLPISESLAEVVTRIRPFYDGIVLRAAKEYNLNSCIIVGHGSSVRSLLKIIVTSTKSHHRPEGIFSNEIIRLQK